MLQTGDVNQTIVLTVALGVVLFSVWVNVLFGGLFHSRKTHKHKDLETETVVRNGEHMMFICPITFELLDVTLGAYPIPKYIDCSCIYDITSNIAQTIILASYGMLDDETHNVVINRNGKVVITLLYGSPEMTDIHEIIVGHAIDRKL